jgi:CIC family chloride channel protein
VTPEEEPEPSPSEQPSTEPPRSELPPSSTATPIGLWAQRGPNAIFVNAFRRLRTVVRLWRLYWLRIEMRLVPTEAQRLFALTVVIGVSCGVAAVGFHVAIDVAEHALIDRAMAVPDRWWMFWTIVTPTVGGMICGALLEYVVPEARGSGIPQVKATFAMRGRRLRLRDSIGKFLIGSLQIGSGASLGREGPTVQICAGIASALGRVAGVSPRSLRRLLPVGAAAGIAAAFNAPLAAVTFTIEEVVGDLDKSVLSGVIIAAALAAVIERSVLGEHPVFEVPPGYALRHASSLLIYAVLGVAAALVSIAFTDSLLFLRKWFRQLRAVPAWARPGIGGMVTGVLAVIALQWLKTRGVTGGGYETLARALAGGLPVKLMLVLCLMKITATVFSYSSGGAGGIFAPALFIGGMLGGSLGALDMQLFDHGYLDIGAFALVGMGAVFSGIIRAPMTSVLIIIEMTSGYSLILPLMIANMTAYGLARYLRPTPIYEALLEQDGIHLRDKGVMDVLEGIHIDHVLVRDASLITFNPGVLARELMRTKSPQEVYPVVDAAGKMVGIITQEEIEMLQAEPDLELLVNAADVMRQPASVKMDDDLHMALETMLAQGIRRLPVLDAGGAVQGFVDEAAIAKAYLHQHTARAD